VRRKLAVLSACALVLVAMLVAAPTASAQAPPDATCLELVGLPSPPQSFIGNPAYFNACVKPHPPGSVGGPL
jgi:hypothetical protein